VKIVTWNCNGAFRKKFEELKVFDADIYVIQECENPSLSKHSAYQDWAKNYLWIGDTKNKGLAVFANEGVQLEKLGWPSQYQDFNLKHFLACRINDEFNLIAVWAHQNVDSNFPYIGQLWLYIQLNSDFLKDSFVVGDFNSNFIWDKKNRAWNHSNVVAELKELGMKSVYHEQFQEEQGSESIPSFYLQRNQEKPYHIDYIFGPNKYVEKTAFLKIGSPEEWLSLSDHMPILCEFH
jgi:exonuclease III